MSLVADTEQPTVRRLRVRPLWIVLGIVALFGFVAVSLLTPSPGTVDRVTIKNGSEFDVNIDATNASYDGWTPVGIALARADTDMREIIDHGDVWIFRFTGQGIDAGELRVTRSDLAASGWALAVPDAVVQRLRAAGVPASISSRA
jgi:hypothetical protein